MPPDSSTSTPQDNKFPASDAKLPLICHIIYRLGVGGLENGLVNLINHLPGDAYRHAVICLTEATEFRHRIQRSGVAIREINKGQGKDIAAYGRVWRTLRELRPRIVHTRNLPAIDMLLPAKLAGVPRLVHSEHGFDMVELDGKNRRYNRLRWMSRVLVDRYIAVSRDINDWLRRDVGIPEQRLSLIYNGVDTDRFKPGRIVPSPLPDGFAPPGAVIFGTTGRLERVKDQITLARAFCRALHHRPALRATLRLVIIGDGGLRGEIEAILDAEKARDLAWLPGYRDDTAALYRALDVFVLPSLREGISNTVLEAMSSGIPIIATRVGGNPEIIPEGEVGTLVPPADVAAMAEAILRYAEDPGLRQRQGEAARRHTIERFSLDAMMRNYDRIYRSLL